MAVSYQRIKAFTQNGNLVMPNGTVIKPISIRKEAVTNLINGQVDEPLQATPISGAYSPVLDSTTATVPTPENNSSVVDTQTSTVPNFQDSIAGEAPVGTPTEQKSKEEPVISVTGQAVDAPKVDSSTNSGFSAPIDPSDLLGDKQVITDQTVSTEAQNNNQLLEAPSKEKELIALEEQLAKAREGLDLAGQLIEQAKLALSSVKDLEDQDQYKRAA